MSHYHMHPLNKGPQKQWLIDGYYNLTHKLYTSLSSWLQTKVTYRKAWKSSSTGLSLRGDRKKKEEELFSIRNTWGLCELDERRSVLRDTVLFLQTQLCRNWGWRTGAFLLYRKHFVWDEETKTNKALKTVGHQLKFNTEKNKLKNIKELSLFRTWERMRQG